MELEKEKLILVLPLAVILIIALIFIFTRDEGANIEQPMPVDQHGALNSPLDGKITSSIQMTGQEIANKQLAFINSLKRGNNQYYKQFECLNLECKPVAYSGSEQGQVLLDKALIHFVQYKISRDANEKEKTRDALQKLIKKREADPSLLLGHFAKDLIPILESDMFKGDEIESKLVSLINAMLLMQQYSPYDSIDFSDNPIAYYTTQDPPLPVDPAEVNTVMQKSFIMQFGRLASSYARAAKIETDLPFDAKIHAAENILTNANKWYAVLDESQPIPEYRGYKEGGCYIAKAHLDLFHATKDQNYLDFPIDFFKTNKLPLIYSHDIQDLPSWARDIQHVLPCIQALAELQGIKGGDYLDQAIAVSEFFLSNTFDYSGTRGWIRGAGAIERVRDLEDVDQPLSLNLQAAAQFSSDQMKLITFRIKKNEE